MTSEERLAYLVHQGWAVHNETRRPPKVTDKLLVKHRKLSFLWPLADAFQLQIDADQNADAVALLLLRA